MPYPNRTRKAALAALKTDALLLEAVEVEPRLKPILEEARKQKNVPGYHRIRTYLALKERMEPLVGWEAKDERLQTMQHYDAVLGMMSDLLPQDDVDIYPDGRPGGSRVAQSADPASPVGKFFHSVYEKGEADSGGELMEGKIKWQGRVLSAQPGDCFLVQLYSWVHGGETDRKLIPVAQMVNWIFYPSQAAWNRAGDAVFGS